GECCSEQASLFHSRGWAGPRGALPVFGEREWTLERRSRWGRARSLFTISGRSDAGNCTLSQPNFEVMHQLGNLIFRIPTPLYGSGLIENIADATTLA